MFNDSSVRDDRGDGDGDDARGHDGCSCRPSDIRTRRLSIRGNRRVLQIR